ncbi:Acriflavin resistance protein [hydrothermal vent metagenome]|uniref:Acriflavin resistance protein n=1 Tax=hydrothermal vent metagenome TaxID=652676 RepID=A0A1W1C817_9ZZZZ
MPKLAINTISIQTKYPSASPEDVEKLITIKIEEKIKSIVGIKKYTSTSSESFSDIVIEYDEKSQNRIELMQKIRDAVARVELPSIVKPPKVIQYESSQISILSIGLFVKNDLPYSKLREISYNLSEIITRQKGVSSVKKNGYLDREVKIFLDQEKILKHNLTIDTIVNYIKQRNTRITAGKFIRDNKEQNIVIISEFKDPKDIEEVIISNVFGAPIVRLKDVATFEISYKKPKSIIHIDGKRALYLDIKKTIDSDIITTVSNIKKVVNEFKKTLDKEVEFKYYNDAAKSVNKRLNVTISNGLSGLLLVLLVLTLFLDKRIAFWVSLGIPVSLLGAIFYLDMANETLNLVSMIGMILVIGIIVDDAIVVSENIEKHRHLGKPKTQATIDALSEVFPPIITSSLTTIAAFSPLLLMDNTMGKFLFLIPLTVIIALIISVLEVVISLPAHLNHIENIKKKTWFEPIEIKFQSVAIKLFHKRYLIVFLFILLLIGTIFLWMTKLPFLLNGDGNVNSISLEIEPPEHYNLEKRINAVKNIEEIFQKNIKKSEVKSIISFINSSGSSNIEVSLTHIDKRNRTANQIIEQLKKKTDHIKTVKLYYSGASQLGVGKAIELNIISKNDLVREKAASKTIEYLKSYDGIYSIKNNDNLGKPQYRVVIDYEKAAKLNISINSLNRYVRIALDGEKVTEIRHQNETVEFRVKFKNTVKDYAQLKKLKIANRNGRLIPVVNFTDLLRTKPSVNIEHYNGRRVTKITASVDKQKINPLEVSQKIKEQLLAEYKQLEVQLGGEAKESQESSVALLKSFVIALIVIYAILFLLLNSFVQPILVMLAVPFAFIGVVWAFYLHDEVLSFFALVGSVGLIGVVVNDSLLLINHFNNKIKDSINLVEQVAKRTSQRLRAIDSATLTTFLGVIPMVYNLFGSEAILRPMAMAISYGLLFATLLILVLLPCFYLIYKDFSNKFLKQKAFD